ncbi:MAG: 50S ribosomal protein L32 [candidate division Zixibacteria bacterium]|nr:50S ribosomal protein L32 [candidate division Zixibacteria bacterium]
MAHPKRKQSSTRGKKRRTNWKIAMPIPVDCPHCHQARMPHHICPNCGYYKGRQIIDIKEV